MTTPTLLQAATQAADALEACTTEEGPEQHELDAARETLAALRAAIAAPQPEPVARVAEVHMSRYTIEWTNGPLPEGANLYAAPPAAPAPAVPNDAAWNALARLFHNGEEVEGDDGAAMMVDMALWHEASEAFESLIGEGDAETFASSAAPAVPDGMVLVPQTLVSQLQDALEVAQAGLLWYQDANPDQVSGCDDETMAEIAAALAASPAQPAAQPSAESLMLWRAAGALGAPGKTTLAVQYENDGYLVAIKVPYGNPDYGRSALLEAIDDAVTKLLNPDAQPAAPAVPDGMVMAPREPTHEMLYAMAELDGWRKGDRDHPMFTRWRDYWNAALYAAPQAVPAPAVREPLTTDRIAELWVEILLTTPPNGIHEEEGLPWARLARAVEQEHDIGITGGGNE